MHLTLILLFAMTPVVLRAAESLPVSGGQSPNGVYRLVLRSPAAKDDGTTLEVININSHKTALTLELSSYSEVPHLADSSITVCSWSPDSKHFALMTRETKRTFKTSIYSVGKQFKQIGIPDPTNFILKSLNQTEIFRFLRETPIRWLDSEHVVLKIEGDCGKAPAVLIYESEVKISITSGHLSVLNR